MAGAARRWPWRVTARPKHKLLKVVKVFGLSLWPLLPPFLFLILRKKLFSANVVLTGSLPVILSLLQFLSSLVFLQPFVT